MVTSMDDIIMDPAVVQAETDSFTFSPAHVVSVVTVAMPTVHYLEMILYSGKSYSGLGPVSTSESARYLASPPRPSLFVF